MALKAWWPSTAALSRLVLAASRISPQMALDATREMSDPELRVLCEFRLANDRLGVRLGRSTIMVSKKSSNWAVMSGPEK